RIHKKGLFEERTEISPENPVKVTREIITGYLKKPKIECEKIHPISHVGIVNGLYATEIGYGGIIKIFIQKALYSGKNKFGLKLTGSQGKVMKESVNF